MKANVTVKWYGDLAIEKQRTAAKKAIHDAAEYMLEESNKIVPFDLGELQTSGDTDVDVNLSGVSASIFYDTKYAARLHEHPEYNFQNGREGKYLEKTITNQKGIVKEYLIKAYKSTFNK